MAGAAGDAFVLVEGAGLGGAVVGEGAGGAVVGAERAVDTLGRVLDGQAVLPRLRALRLRGGADGAPAAAGGGGAGGARIY